MATESQNTKESKVLSVADNMTARRIFLNATDAAAYLTKCATDYPDFASTPFVGPGISAQGEFDPAIYTDSSEIMVAKLSGKGSGVKAVVVLPIPSLDSLLASEAGREFVQKIVYKELNHVGVRPLREAEDIASVADQVPTTLEGFISSGRDGNAGILESFNELYKPVNSVLSSKVPAWNKARFTKGELRKALESKAYALEWYNAVEDRGEGKDSLLVTALHMLIGAAKSKGLDPTIFERWLATRDQKTIAVEQEDELDLDSLTGLMLAEPEAKADEPAA